MIDVDQEIGIFFNTSFKDIRHGFRLVSNHLINTYGILDTWNVEDYIKMAGLFHAIYGTDRYHNPIPKKRAEVREILGETCEELVFYYSQLKNQEIIKICKNARFPVVKHFGEISAPLFNSICLVAAANKIELITFLNNHLEQSDKRFLTCLKPHLTTNAIKQINKIIE